MKDYGKLATMLLVFWVVVILLSEPYALAQVNQTSSQFQTANNAVEQAFNAVHSAETANANITNIQNQLNNAATLLAQAENANLTGDQNTALNDATSVIAIANQVTTQANTLKNSGANSSKPYFQFTVFATVIVSGMFLVGLFMVWRRFKRNYLKRLQKSKVEIVAI